MRPDDVDLANLPLWVARGYDPGDARRFLAMYAGILASTNLIVDLKLPLAANVS